MPSDLLVATYASVIAVLLISITLVLVFIQGLPAHALAAAFDAMAANGVP